MSKKINKKKVQIVKSDYEKKFSIRELLFFVSACTITVAVIIFVHRLPFLPFYMPRIPFADLYSNKPAFADTFNVFKQLSAENKNKILLIDMRSANDYKEKRFKNSVNVYFPYEPDAKSEHQFVDKVAGMAPKYNQIVLLPYSSASTTADRAYLALTKSGVKKVLISKLGWNEMYSLPNLWIPEEYQKDYPLTVFLDE